MERQQIGSGSSVQQPKGKMKMKEVTAVEENITLQLGHVRRTNGPKWAAV